MVTRGVSDWPSPVYTSDPGGRPGVLPRGRNSFLRLAGLRATSVSGSAPFRKDALEQCNQLGTLACRKVLHDPALMLGHFAFQPAQQHGAFVRQEQAVTA